MPLANGAVGWKVVAPRFLGHKVPLEAMQGVENGLAELRKDERFRVLISKMCEDRANPDCVYGGQKDNRER